MSHFHSYVTNYQRATLTKPPVILVAYTPFYWLVGDYMTRCAWRETTKLREGQPARFVTQQGFHEDFEWITVKVVERNAQT